MALDVQLEPDHFGWPRIAELAASAITEIQEQTEGAIPASERFTVLLTLPETRPGFSEASARQVADAVSARVRSSARPLGVEIVGRGHAGGLEALAVAAERAGRGRGRGQGRFFLVCGAESYLEEDTLDWLEEHGRLMAAGVRNGFVPGEAAGALLLATGDAIDRCSLSPFAAVRGVGMSTERRTLLSGQESFGEGLTRAIEAALSGLQLPEEAVDAVVCDINGERYRTEEWGFALLRAQHAIKTTDYELHTGSWGDVGAATGALQCIMAVQSWRRNYAEGPRALVCAGSNGGLRGAAVLEAPSPK